MGGHLLQRIVDVGRVRTLIWRETSEAKMLHEEDKRAFATREREFSRHGNVQDKITFFKENKSRKVLTCKSKSVLK